MSRSSQSCVYSDKYVCLTTRVCDVTARQKSRDSYIHCCPPITLFITVIRRDSAQLHSVCMYGDESRFGGRRGPKKLPAGILNGMPPHKIITPRCWGLVKVITMFVCFAGVRIVFALRIGNSCHR
jgi:hypothetical protein